MGLFVFLIIAILAVLLFGSLLGWAIGLILAVISWMLAGMFAGRLLRGRGYGPMADIVLGLVGRLCRELCPPSGRHQLGR